MCVCVCDRACGLGCKLRCHAAERNGSSPAMARNRGGAAINPAAAAGAIAELCPERSTESGVFGTVPQVNVLLIVHDVKITHLRGLYHMPAPLGRRQVSSSSAPQLFWREQPPPYG